MTPAAVVVMELRLVVGDGGSGDDGAAEGDDDAKRSGARSESLNGGGSNEEVAESSLFGRLVVGWSVAAAMVAACKGIVGGIGGHGGWAVGIGVPSESVVPSASAAMVGGPSASAVPSACIGRRNWTVMVSVPQRRAVLLASSRWHLSASSCWHLSAAG